MTWKSWTGITNSELSAAMLGSIPAAASKGFQLGLKQTIRGKDGALYSHEGDRRALEVETVCGLCARIDGHAALVERVSISFYNRLLPGNVFRVAS